MSTPTTPPSAPIRDTALFYHSLGLNVIANEPGTKKPCHLWKGGKYQRGPKAGQAGPNWTTQQQTYDDVIGLPWRKAGAIGLVNGIGGLRTLDFDKCPNDAPVKAALAAMGLPDDYVWQGISGSHTGYGLAVICDELPPGLFDQAGILIGQPREPGAFQQLELRAYGCQTLVAPSRHKSGNCYEWLYGEPTAPPARVSADQMMAGFLAVAALTRKEAPAPKPAQRQAAPHPAGEQRSGESPCDRILRENDLGDFLEAHGADLVVTRGTSRYYSGLTGDKHSGDYTYVVTPSTSRPGQIGYSYSPNGKLNKGDFPRGFNYIDAKKAVDNVDLVPPKAEPSASQSAGQAPGQATDADRARKAQEAARVRQARQDTAAALRDDILGRAAIDEEMPAQARQLLDIHLTIVGQRGWHRASVARLAELAGYGERWVQRHNEYLIAGGYLDRDQRDYTETAVWTLRKSDLCRIAAPQTIDDRVIAIAAPQQDAELSERSPVYILEHVFHDTRDLAGEGGASSTPAGACDEWEIWEAIDDGHGAAELAGLAEPENQKVFDFAPLLELGESAESVQALGRFGELPQIETIAVAPAVAVEPPAVELLTQVRQLAKQAAEPGWYLRDYAEWAAADLELEAARLAGLVEPASDMPPASTGAFLQLTGEIPQSVEPSDAGAVAQIETNWFQSNPLSTGRASSGDAPAVEPQNLTKPDTGQPSSVDDAAIRAAIAAHFAHESSRARSATDEQTPLDMSEQAPQKQKKAPARPSQRAQIAALADGPLLAELKDKRGVAIYGKKEHTRQWAANRAKLLDAERRARGLPDPVPGQKRRRSARSGTTADSPPLTSPAASRTGLAVLGGEQAALWGAS